MDPHAGLHGGQSAGPPGPDGQRMAGDDPGTNRQPRARSPTGERAAAEDRPEQAAVARLPQADPVCDAATVRHTAVHVRTPSPAGGPGVGGSGLRRCAVLAARCRDPCLTTVCDPTPHLGANGIMKEVIAMPSEASHAPESLQTPRPRAALADDHASAVLERYLRDVRRFPVLSHARERAL